MHGNQRTTQVHITMTLKENRRLKNFAIIVDVRINNSTYIALVKARDRSAMS